MTAQGNIEDDLKEWLSTDEGRDCRIPSTELRYETYDSESKIDAMLINSEAIHNSWDFILEKRARGIEMFPLCHSVLEALKDCHHLRKIVLLGVTTIREAILTARLALTSLEQLYSKFKEFMEMFPEEREYPGLFFMLRVERIDCSDEQDIFNAVVFILPGYQDYEFYNII